MPNKIILKKSSIQNKVPTTSDLDYGELAINYTDGLLYYKNSSDTVLPLNPTYVEVDTLQDVTTRGQTSGYSTTNQKIEITNTEQSTGNDGNLTAGALIVRGGMGIEKDLHIKGDIHLVGTGTLRFGPYDVGTNTGNLWWVRPGGLDLDPNTVNGAGQQLWTAFGTIKHALKYADFGDTVLVQPGDYEEIFPLYVPQGVSIRGAGLRETQIYPTSGTNNKDAFLLSGDSTISDFTVKNFYYSSGNDTGYAFRFSSYSATITSGQATITVADTTALEAGQKLTKISGTGVFGTNPTIASVDSATQITLNVNHVTSGSIVFSVAKMTARSTYIERCTVLTKGSVTSSSDPYGFDQGDAGRGALIDGSLISRDSLEAAMLFNEVTFITPNSRGVIMTNGARSEILTSFFYFADLAVEGKVGTAGRGMDGKTYLTFSGISGSGFQVGETIRFIGTGGTPTVDFTVESVSGSKVTVDGSLNGLDGLDLSPGAGGSITGLTSGTTATAITRYDRSEFAAELRSIANAYVYGNQGIKADGADVLLQLMAHNFAYIGTGADLTNNKAAVVQANEVIEANGGRVYYNSSDQAGDFRVGDYFRVNFATGDVTFNGGSFDVSALGSINFTDGGNTTTVQASGITTGNLSFAGNSITTSSGNITIDPAGSGTIALNGGTTVTGAFSATGATTLTAGTASSSTGTGTLVVTGGVGVSGTVYAGGFNGSLTGTASLATNLSGGTSAGQVAYQSAANTTTFSSAPGGAGTYLRWNGSTIDWNAATFTVAGSSGQIQYNSGGNAAASSNLTYDSVNNTLSVVGTNPDILFNASTVDPATPAAGQMSLYAKSIGGKVLPNFIGSYGWDNIVQTSIAMSKVAIYSPIGNATTAPTAFGFAFTTNGTATARNVATTNVFTRARRLSYVSAATAGSYAGIYNAAAGTQYTIGTGTAGVGGFFFVARFGFVDTVAQAIKFIGMTATTAAPTVTASPATFVNSIGVGCATGDTNLSIYYGGSAAQTPIALGASFPAKTNTTDWYELTLFAPGNANNTVGYRVINITTGATAEGTLTAATPGTQLPSSTTLLGPRLFTSNNATAAAVAIDIGNIYLETDT